jgi:signal peptidase I
MRSEIIKEFFISQVIKNNAVSKKRIIQKIIKILFFLIAAIVLSILINIFIFEIAVVEGISMEKTLYSGDRLIIVKLAYFFYSPENDDIIVLRYKTGMSPFLNFFIDKILGKKVMTNTDTEVDYIKRIIGSQGDVIDLKYDRVYLNNKILEEPYTSGITNKKSLTYPIIIPKQNFFIMGDNRSSSRDSRDIGVIDKNEIIGKAVFRIWPLDKIGIIK